MSIWKQLWCDSTQPTEFHTGSLNQTQHLQLLTNLPDTSHISEKQTKNFDKLCYDKELRHEIFRPDVQKYMGP